MWIYFDSKDGFLTDHFIGQLTDYLYVVTGCSYINTLVNDSWSSRNLYKNDKLSTDKQMSKYNQIT